MRTRKRPAPRRLATAAAALLACALAAAARAANEEPQTPPVPADLAPAAAAADRSRVTPAVAVVPAGGARAFVAELPGAAATAVGWAVVDGHGRADPAGGTISPAGAYVAPAVPGVYYVRAEQAGDAATAAYATVVVTGGRDEPLLAADFEADKAADPATAFDRAAPPADPAGPRAGGVTFVVADGDDGRTGNGATHADVLDDAAAAYPGAFAGKSLLLYDNSDWAMSFGADWGRPLASGTVSLKFYDAGLSAQGMTIALASALAGPADARVTAADAVASVTLRDGTATLAGGGSVAYAVGAVHALSLAYDGGARRVTLRVGAAPPVSAAVAAAAAAGPAAVSFSTGVAWHRSGGPLLVDDLAVAGVPAPAGARVAAAALPVRVDWAATEFATNRHSFGLNGFNAFDDRAAADPAYRANMAYMNPGLVRYHSWEMLQDSARPNGWLDTANARWDAAKINRALGGYPPAGVDAVMSIPGWPKWMKAGKDGHLDPSEFAAFAAFCADLVRIVNVDGRKGVKYWEITNEMDGRYGFDLTRTGQPDRYDELCAIYNTCAAAMKAVDPTILTGGPAAARGDLVELHRKFVRGTVPHLDFFSYHAYVSGNTADPDWQVYDKTDLIGEFGRGLRRILDAERPGRRVPVHLNEYNVSWTWRTREPRMLTHKGGVFDALTLIAAARGGVDATNAWNERDGVFGKTSPANELRPPAHVFHLFNGWCVGDAVRAQSADPRRVTAFAVRRPGGTRAVVLVNRTDLIQPARADLSDWRPATLHGLRMAGDTFGPPAAPHRPGDTWFLPPHSVTLLTDDPTAARP